jgi:hypothetical protein
VGFVDNVTGADFLQVLQLSSANIISPWLSMLISSRGLTIGLLVATIQRQSLIP